MKYNPKFLTDLRVINKKIDNNQIEGPNNALDLFAKYLSSIILLERFNSTEWNSIWRNEVYNFGEKFKEIDSVDFLYAIDNAKNGLNKDQKEVLDFFKSEIRINNLTFDDIIEDTKKVIKEYPYNPEFRHNLGHIYAAENKLEQSIEQYEFALKKDGNNKTFLKNLFNVQYKYIQQSIDDETYEKGLKYLNNILNSKKYDDSYVFKNLLIGLKQRLNDYKILSDKILSAEKVFEKKIKEISEKERRRVIEILGFFSAIMAFIFSTISIGKEFNYSEAISFSVSLGFVLIIFLVSLNILFSSESLKHSWIKFLVLIILVLSLLLILSKYTLPLWTN